jgi:ribosomal protein S12 methylthiotransferase accessory factor
MSQWYSSAFTGLFTEFGPLPLRAHDPDLSVYAGTLPPSGPRRDELAVGGASWSQDEAEAACLGEAIERLEAYPLHTDELIEGSYAGWPLAEPAVNPSHWVLFHPEQYARPGFPFQPFTQDTCCRWLGCRDARTGEAWWVPEDFVYIFPSTNKKHTICPGISTGLSAGRWGSPVLLRGLQEVIERDAVVGAWWGHYSLFEWSRDAVLGLLEPAVADRIERPGLRYRFYRASSPFSDHVALVTVEGGDREGYCFSIGSACRQTRQAAWLKAIAEAIHGRHYVRYQSRARSRDTGRKDKPARYATGPESPSNFAEHALYYSLHPEQLDRTVLHRAGRDDEKQEDVVEDISLLLQRLGPDRRVLFRNMSPTGIVAEVPDWYVLRVIVPGLQPLHGNHALAHLGGSLWSGRGLADWAAMPPHPFP